MTNKKPCPDGGLMKTTTTTIVLGELDEIRGYLARIVDSSAVIQCSRYYQVELDRETLRLLEEFVGQTVSLLRMDGKIRLKTERKRKFARSPPSLPHQVTE
jgi:hypothetical protein